MKDKAIVIEFVGPPGAGKTTCCQYFTERLEKRGLKVYTLQDLKDYIRNLSLLEKLFLSIKAGVFRSHTLLFYTLSLAYNRIISADSIYRYIRLTLFDLALKQFKKKKDVDIVILEQWIIQELWSATIFKLKSYNRVRKHLSRFFFKTDFVFYFDIDVRTASERIRVRNMGKSRFDKMDPQKRIEELMKYKTYLYQLYEISDCKRKYSLAGENSPEKNAELFVQHINYSKPF
jgi:thymidylate kinase